jgi:2-polyprenyl-3-methyl-5-hydroxy-6-metoxy-1,4-benzoquinol methylase
VNVQASPKPEGYYGSVRQDLVDALPRPLGRVLDVGCGAGATGPSLRAAGAEHLTGIEIVPGAAELARQHYDVVIAAPVEQGLDQVEGGFDTVLCMDVLEHLVDPGAVLRRLHGLARPAGRLEVSVPNARHYSVALNVFVRGTFAYARSGIFDSTHLRWFTRRDITELIAASGWRVERVWHPPPSRFRRIGAVGGRRASEFITEQWYTLSVRA